MAKDIKIIQVAYSFSRGGAGAAAKNVCQNLEKRYDVKAVSALGFDKNEKISMQFKYCIWLISRVFEHLFTGLLFYNFNVKQSLNLFSSPRIGELLRDAETKSVYHFHWINNDSISASDLKNIPPFSLITLHDEWLIAGTSHYDKSSNFDPSPSRKMTWYQSKIDGWLRRKKATAIDKMVSPRIVCPSSWLRDRVIASGLFKPDQIHIVPNIIDTSVFYPCVDENEVRFLKKKYGVESSEKIFCFGANNSANNPIKGGDLLAPVINDLAAKLSSSVEVTIILFGGISSPVSVPKNISIVNVGVVRDQSVLRDIYALSDLLLFLSKAEAFGLVAAEAMSCGTPVLGLAGTSISDFVIPNFTGILVDDLRAASITEEIISFVEWSDNQNIEIRSNCRRYVEATFSKSAVNPVYDALVKNICLRK
jgi:glycosyltransferase involved in cell wall biosynthesis